MKKFLLLSLTCLLSKMASSQAYNAGTILANHTDLNPDTLMHYVYYPYTHQVYDVDIFGSTPDIEFVADGSSSPGGSSAYINIKSLNPSVSIRLARLDSVYDSNNHLWIVTKVARPLNAGDPINAPDASWDNNMLYISDHSASFGWTKNVNDWIGTGDKYIGLKYDNGSSVAYGWIKLNCISKDSCYVKEFSSTVLLAGVKENSKSATLLYPNPCSGKFTIRLSGIADEICVYNSAGNCVFTKRSSGQGLTEEIDISAQPRGLYWLCVRTKNETLHRKIVKE